MKKNQSRQEKSTKSKRRSERKARKPKCRIELWFLVEKFIQLLPSILRLLESQNELTQLFENLW